MQRHDALSVAIIFAALATGCAKERDPMLSGTPGGDDFGSSGEVDTTTLTTASPSTDGADDRPDGTDTLDPDDTTGAGTGTVDASTGRDSSEDGSTGGDPSDDTDDDTGSPFGTLPHAEAFEGIDGGPWPAPWAVSGEGVVSSTLEGGRGRLVGSPTNVARMVLPGFTETDVDVTVTVEFDAWASQGFGLYVRQNGGALHWTDPPGQGYAAYVEGGWMQFIGIWRETNGVEELLQGVPVPGGTLQNGVPYRVRLQCRQEGEHTRLRTRIWPVGQAEPAMWHVDITDTTPVLQNTAGSFALDVYNYGGMGGIYVDDLQIDPLL